MIERAPDVLYAGCQPAYGEQTIFQHKNSKESAVKLLSVPTFAKTRSIVLLDLQTLQSYELKFGKAFNMAQTDSDPAGANAEMMTQWFLIFIYLLQLS